MKKAKKKVAKKQAKKNLKKGKKSKTTGLAKKGVKGKHRGLVKTEEDQQKGAVAELSGQPVVGQRKQQNVSTL